MLYTSFLSFSQSESWAFETWSKHTFEIKLELVDLHFSHNAALLFCDLLLKYTSILPIFNSICIISLLNLLVFTLVIQK